MSTVESTCFKSSLIRICQKDQMTVEFFNKDNLVSLVEIL